MNTHTKVTVVVKVDHEPSAWEEDAAFATIDALTAEYVSDLTSALPDGWTAEEA